MAAHARIRYEWADGESLEVVVRVDSSYPDSVHEARAQALALFREGWDAALPAVEGE